MLHRVSSNSSAVPAARFIVSALRTCAACGPCRQLSRLPVTAATLTNSSGLQNGSLLKVGVIAPQLHQMRFYDSCKSTKEPICGPANIKKSCGGQSKKPKEEKKEKKDEKKSKSMWAIEGCEVEDPCELPVRYDVMYYRITDKLKRKYQVTWRECPRLLIKPKKVCIYDKLQMPEIPRRKRPYTPDTACSFAIASDTCGKMKQKTRCPRATMPCCKDARIPPSCTTMRKPLDCKKRKAPYPSFSECKKDELREPPPTECHCLDQMSLCEAWAELRKRIASGRGEFKCGKL